MPQSTSTSNWPYGGYEWIEYMQKVRVEGWRLVPSWGADGWDLGDWPLVIVHHRDTPPMLRYYVEGDVTQMWFDTIEERDAETDRIAMYHWKHEDAPWLATEEPERLRGPYREGRSA